MNDQKKNGKKSNGAIKANIDKRYANYRTAPLKQTCFHIVQHN